MTRKKKIPAGLYVHHIMSKKLKQEQNKMQCVFADEQKLLQLWKSKLIIESWRQRSNVNTCLTTYCIHTEETGYTLLHVERGNKKSKRKKKRQKIEREIQASPLAHVSQRIISRLEMV